METIKSTRSLGQWSKKKTGALGLGSYRRLSMT
ncbi:hypothetical protein LINPERHAP2_LOCUS28616 [Linum perenne]